MDRDEQEETFERAYDLSERVESGLPWKWIAAGVAALVVHFWITDAGPFQPRVDFDFRDHATEHDEYIAVDVDTRHWRLSKAPRVEGAYRVYGVSFLESGERPPDGPWSIVSHSLLLEPLQVNQAKWAKFGHEESGHSDWTLFTSRATNDGVLQQLAGLQPVGSRQCAMLTARNMELLGFHDDNLAQQLTWQESCTGHQRCNSGHLLVIEAVRAIDCNSELPSP